LGHFIIPIYTTRRGPRKNGMIKQFLIETNWCEDERLDYLLIDTPPGTSDEHISTVQLLQGALGGGGAFGGAVVVTTPEEGKKLGDVYCTSKFVPVDKRVST